jgi:PhnB protein
MSYHVFFYFLKIYIDLIYYIEAQIYRALSYNPFTMTTLNPYLKFNDDTCREAMEFYKSIFGGEHTYMTLGDSPMASEMPPETHNKVMHVEFKAPGILFYASDMMRDKATVGDNVGLSLNYTDLDEQKKHFEMLAEGGEIFMPLEKAFWGSIFGVVTDKYGIEWTLNCTTIA